MVLGKQKLRLILSILVAVVIAAALFHPTAPSSAATVRVVVRGETLAAAKAAVVACSGTVESEITIIDAVIADVPEAQLVALSQAPGITLVTPDREVQVSEQEAKRGPAGNDLVHFTETIGVDEVWAAGDLGQSITVAVLDTGIDPTFSELRRTWGERRTERFLAYYDAIEDKLYKHPQMLRSPRDPNGHGTHVAGIIGNGSHESRDGGYRGVAPGANLVAVRVLGEEGAGSYSDVLRGLEWVVNNKDRYNIRVLNISMYSVPVAPYWADPYNLAVMAAWDAGIVVVASAGNTGPDPMSVGVPGNTPYIITVGAFTDHRTPGDFGDDYIPEFSASGPTLDAFIKPDVIAPGAHMVSLMRPKAHLREINPERRVNGRYFEMSGTSMSTAVVSGIAALILEENPDLTPDQVKYRLTQSARPQLTQSARPQVSSAVGSAAYSVWEQGAGRVWAEEAVFGDITGEANRGMDIATDLAGVTHYQGWTTFEEQAGEFKIIGGGFDGWIGDYTTWDGSFDSWADGYAEWSGGTTNWADSFDSWADSFDSWADNAGGYADSFDSWADSFDSWADSFDSWADTCVADPGQTDAWEDSFDSWADSFDSWADSFDSWADYVAWADSFDSWADSFDSWADSFDSWADGSADCAEWADSFDSWADGYVGWSEGIVTLSDGLTLWTGAYGGWNGGYLAWSSSFDSWADSFDSWADGFTLWASVCGVDTEGFDSWADDFDSWADGFDSWADGFDSWADYVAWVDNFDSWADGFDSWADGFDSWADGFTVETRPVICQAWDGGFDSWADGFDSWADGFDSWADGFDSWADGFDSWADGCSYLAETYNEWDGGYTSWAGGYSTWMETFDSWADNVGDAEWAADYADGTRLPTPLSSVGINIWIDQVE